jgi:putative transposase
MMSAVAQSAPAVGVESACAALSVSRASFYRWRAPRLKKPLPRLAPCALTAEERAHVLEVLNSPRFADKAPFEVYATLLDEGVYLCSIRTMYRLLDQHDLVRERRAITRHIKFEKPELLATGPNQVWSWDITKLKGPMKWSYFYLYVILDIFSRRVVGWYIAARENAVLFQELFQDALAKHDVSSEQLTLHADRGGPMIAKSTAQLMIDLGVTKTHSRPYNSNDNPFSESAFKTIKYRPDFPERFYNIESARAFFRSYFVWYNDEHHHSSLGLMTPNQIHYGQAKIICATRQKVLDKAYQLYPNRFVRKKPTAPQAPDAVWINKPGGEDKKRNEKRTRKNKTRTE